MTVAPDPIAVAAHWPYVRRNLQLARAQPIGRALDVLARRQYDAGGAPVPMGRSSLAAEGLSPGEAGAVYNALVTLEGRRVVKRWRQRGATPDAWSLQGDLRRWRAMPWGAAGKAVGEAVAGCVCSTSRAKAARFPGQSVDRAARFTLSDDDHLFPPGLFLVDSRGFGAGGGALARRPGETPVDSRGFGAAGADPYCFKDEDIRLRRPRDDDEPMSILREVVERLSKAPLFGSPETHLRAIAATLDTEQARVVAARVAAYRRGGEPLRAPTTLVPLAGEIASSSSVLAMRGEEASAL